MTHHVFGDRSQPSEQVISVTLHLHRHPVPLRDARERATLGGTGVAHRVGLFSGRGHQNRHMQHRSNVPTGFDVWFSSWPKWDYVGKTCRGVGWREEMHCGYV